MTAMQLARLKQDAQETVDSIDPDKLTKSTYTLLGASLAILDHNISAQPETSSSASTRPLQTTQSSVQDIVVESLSDELRDSEKYYKLWKETGLSDYKRLALDELNHYETLVKIIYASDPNININDTMTRHDLLSAKLGAYEPIDYIGDSLVDEKKQESLRFFVEYSNEKALEITMNSELHGEKAEQALRRMLDTDYEVAKSLIQAADEREKVLIRDSYRKIALL